MAKVNQKEIEITVHVKLSGETYYKLRRRADEDGRTLHSLLKKIITEQANG